MSSLNDIAVKGGQHTRYVWYSGKCWQYEGLPNHKGHVSLIDLKDSSLGVYVDPEKVRNCTNEEMDALHYFLFSEGPFIPIATA